MDGRRIPQFSYRLAQSLFLVAMSDGVSVFVECSQLVDVGWLNALRANKVGRLFLGAGFLWLDFLRYLTGASLAFAVDTMWRRTARRH